MLSNSEKRQKYDMFGDDPESNNFQHGHHGFGFDQGQAFTVRMGDFGGFEGFGGGFGGFDFDDFMSNFNFGFDHDSLDDQEDDFGGFGHHEHQFGHHGHHFGHHGHHGVSSTRSQCFVYARIKYQLKIKNIKYLLI